jgi:hypothetical protein
MKRGTDPGAVVNWDGEAGLMVLSAVTTVTVKAKIIFIPTTHYF